VEAFCFMSSGHGIMNYRVRNITKHYCIHHKLSSSINAFKNETKMFTLYKKMLANNLMHPVAFLTNVVVGIIMKAFYCCSVVGLCRFHSTWFEVVVAVVVVSCAI
jgi:hypothetical protein